MKRLERGFIGLVLAAGCAAVAWGGVAGCGGSDPATASLEGRWVGELQSGFLPSGSSVVALDLDAAMAGEPVAGTVVFGEGTPPAAPTDPEVGWPAGIDPLMSGVPVADGFEYQVTGGARTGDRVRMDLAVTALWEPWCAIQTPYAVATGTTEAQCLPNREWTTTPFECHLDADAENPELPVDCFKLTLCRRVRVCACTDPGGCVPSEDGLTMTVDLQFDGDVAMGTVSWMREGMPGGTAVVRLTRQ